MLIRKNIISLIILILLVSSCLGPENNPEVVLKKFIHMQFNGKLTRKDVLKKTTGELFEEYSKMTDETFDQLFLQKNLIKKRLKVSFKKCGDNRCSITFSITYDVTNNKKIINKVETKKMASLVKGNESGWKIEKIVNLKSYFENSPIEIK